MAAKISPQSENHCPINSTGLCESGASIGHTTELDSAHDAVGTVGNPICGDQMKMYLQIKDDKIVDIKWKTYGCASAIASTSALSELAKGKTLDDALKIGPEEITEFLGGLPKHKFHCSVLGHEALVAAVEDYRKINQKQIRDPAQAFYA